MRLRRVSVLFHDAVIARGRHEGREPQQHGGESGKECALINRRYRLKVALEKNPELDSDDDLAAQDEKARFVQRSLNLVAQLRHSMGLLR